MHVGSAWTSMSIPRLDWERVVPTASILSPVFLIVNSACRVSRVALLFHAAFPSSTILLFGVFAGIIFESVALCVRPNHPALEQRSNRDPWLSTALAKSLAMGASCNLAPA